MLDYKRFIQQVRSKVSMTLYINNYTNNVRICNSLPQNQLEWQFKATKQIKNELSKTQRPTDIILFLNTGALISANTVNFPVG